MGKIDDGISTNVVVHESSASVDVRALTKKDALRLTKYITSIEAVNPAVKIELTGGFNRPPLLQNPRNKMLWNAAQNIAGELRAL